MRRPGLFKKGRTKSGATAVEFALVAPILLVLMFGLIEAGAVYIGQAWITYATSDLARQIRTGQIRSLSNDPTSGIDATAFRQKVCDKLTGFFTCDSNLQIDVQAYPTFTAADLGAPIDKDGNLDTKLSNFKTGDACQVVLIRVFYKWSVQTPFFTTFLVNMAGNKHLITAAAAYRNEPFTTDVSGC